MRKGSVTVFLAMILVFVLGLGFTMSEVLRFYCMKNQCAAASEVAMESALAGYVRPLWEDYGILAIDGSFGGTEMNLSSLEERLLTYMKKNGSSEGVDYLRTYGADAAVTAYGLLTDDDGRAFIKQAAAYVETSIPETAVDLLLQQVESTREDTENSQSSEELVEAGENAMEEAKEEETSAASAQDSISDQSSSPGENIDGLDILETYHAWKEKGILGMVLPEDAELSDKTFQTSVSLMDRDLLKGDMASAEVTSQERILFGVYLSQCFSDFTDVKDRAGLIYEKEYLLCGEDSDRENLKETINRLLLIREAENLISLYMDSGKQEKAMLIATELAGATANPAIVEAVKIAVLAAWAYVESILDVRLLLKGGTVPILKTEASWTSELGKLPTYLDVNVCAKESTVGLNYGGYLFLMLELSDSGKIAMKTLGLMEDNIRRGEYYEAVQMDHMIVSFRADMTYEAEPLFVNLMPLAVGTVESYSFEAQREAQYLSAA